MSAPKLRGMQWAARGTLVLGVAASVSANVLHAEPNLISQTIAGWPPLALLITVELVSRIPTIRRRLGLVRIVAATGIAAIAAWVSYWHMAGVAARYGEQGSSPYLLPISVDGLIVVASVSLVELSGRVRSEPTRPEQGATAAPSAAIEPEPVAAMPETSSDDSVVGDQSPPPQPSEAETAEGNTASAEDEDHLPLDLAPDLVPLLPAGREARDELLREGRTVSRDALASRLRRNGHAIRNNRVSELLNVLKQESERCGSTVPLRARQEGAEPGQQSRSDLGEPQPLRRRPMAG